MNFVMLGSLSLNLALVQRIEWIMFEGELNAAAVYSENGSVLRIQREEALLLQRAVNPPKPAPAISKK